MQKVVKWVLIIIGALLLLSVLATVILKKSTKQHSPERQLSFTDEELLIDIFYCSPSKKGREIFGGLVPYGEIWRTGANEASTFTTNKNLQFGDQTLEAGRYSIFSIPEKDQWQVIFNKGAYDWGLKWDESSARDKNEGELVIRAVPKALSTAQECFTINITKGEPHQLVLVWDKTRVSLPFEQ